MKKLNFLLFSHIAFLFGVFFSTLFFMDSLEVWHFLVLFVLAIFVSWFFKFGVKVFVVFLFVFTVGVFRFLFSAPDFSSSDLAYYNDEKRFIEVLGCIEDEVDNRRDHSKLTVSAFNIVIDGDVIPVSGNVLVTVPRYLEHFYGECLKLHGVLQDPGEFNEFSYSNYLARYDVFSVMYRPSVQLLDFKKGYMFVEALFSLKNEFEKSLNRIFHEPHSSFAAGLITGSRKGIPDFVMDSFSLTGLTHIIAISGYNITLLIVVISALFGFLSRRLRFILSVIVIVVFTFFVGASAAVVRASIMGIIGLMALQFGRKSFVILVLFFSAVLMNLFNPYILVLDVGFQLSFAATLGLIVFANRFEKYFKWVPQIFTIRESLTMTLAAQVFTVPLIIFHFGRISLISPLANVAVGPLIPFAMLFSFLAVVTGYVWSGFSLIFGFFGWIFLNAIISIAEILAHFPFANLEF